MSTTTSSDTDDNAFSTTIKVAFDSSAETPRVPMRRTYSAREIWKSPARGRAVEAGAHGTGVHVPSAAGPRWFSSVRRRRFSQERGGAWDWLLLLLLILRRGRPPSSSESNISRSTAARSWPARGSRVASTARVSSLAPPPRRTRDRADHGLGEDDVLRGLDGGGGTSHSV